MDFVSRAHVRCLAVAVGLLAWGAFAGVGVVPASSLGAGRARSAGASCRPLGRVALPGPEVLVWSLPDGHWYSCIRASGVVRRIAHANASAKGFLAAGRYVTFTYRFKGEPYLDVFSAASGRTELDENLEAGCGPVNTACVAALAGFQLAPSGWFAKKAPGDSLAAGNGGRSTVDLDDGERLTLVHQHISRANGVELSESAGSALSWTTTGEAGVYSTPLGPPLATLDSAALETGSVRPAAVLPAPCALFTASEVEGVLGAATQSSGGDVCTYTMSGTPRSILRVSLDANLTAAQILAAKQAAYTQAASPSISPGPPDYGKYLWAISWESGSGGESGSQSQSVLILGDLELTVTLATKPTNNATGSQVGTSQCWEAHEAVQHVTDIAFDRSMGVAISYHAHPTARSCANEPF